MMHNIKRKCFEVESRITNLYSGGNVTWSVDGEHLYCQNSDEINIVSVLTGRIIGCIDLKDDLTFNNDVDRLLTFDVSSDNQLVITGHKSGLIKLWSACNGIKIKKWKSNHLGPISKLIFGPCNGIVCSAGLNSIRIWDFTNARFICNIEGQGSISVVSFYPDVSASLLYAAGDNNVINCWNFCTQSLSKTLRGHIAKITSIAFDEQDLRFMASVSVDKVVILWQLTDSSQFKIIPLNESLQGVFFLSSGSINSENTSVGNDAITVLAAGVTGTIYTIQCAEDKVICSQRSTCNIKPHKGIEFVTHLLHCKKLEQFALVTVDHNILFCDICTIECTKTLIGYNEEILDICILGERDQYLAVATNTSSIKLYDILSRNCAIVNGHMDTVLTLTGFENYFLSAGKDFMILIWKLDPVTFTIRCLGKCMGHTSAIGSISLSSHCFSMFGSASQDGCLKLWITNLKNNNKFETFNLKSSIKAHDKEVNCVTFSPNNNIIATASQDKNIKIWNSQNLSLIGTLRGHRKGVWTARFSPVDQILISTSSDCSIRIWSLSTLVCLTKIEEECSILRGEFICQGKLLISTAADGLIKIWNIRSMECISIFDEHRDRVWAIAVSADELCFYSGGADSELIYWNDVTEQRINQIVKEKQVLSSRSQMLNNFIKDNKIERAFPLSLSLSRPVISLKILSNIIKKRSPLNIDMKHLSNDEVNNLHKHMCSWNTNTRFCKASQLVLFAIINEIILNRLDLYNPGKLIEDMYPYTERHYKRISLYMKELHFLDFTIKCM